jgi:hypothetical protein
MPIGKLSARNSTAAVQMLKLVPVLVAKVGVMLLGVDKNCRPEEKPPH